MSGDWFFWCTSIEGVMGLLAVLLALLRRRDPRGKPLAASQRATLLLLGALLIALWLAHTPDFFGWRLFSWLPGIMWLVYILIGAGFLFVILWGLSGENARARALPASRDQEP